MEGDVLKFGGDALLIFFDGPGHLERACAAADSMRRTLRQVGTVSVGTRTVTLRMSQGLHSGDFDFFLVGDRHQELVVAGPAATKTVDMESAAAAQEVLLSPEAAQGLDARHLGAEKDGGRLLRSAPPCHAGSHDPGPVLAAPEQLEVFVPLALRGRLDFIVAESEHRQATVAFLHFLGLDQLLLERGPAEVHRRLHALTCAVVSAMAEFGVCILCTDIGPDGGKFMLVSGAPEAFEDAEERMLRACRTVLEVDHGLPIRIGVNRGHVYGGAVGGPSRFTYSTMGDAVNLAARVMGKAAPGQLLATAAVMAQCPGRFAVQPLDPFMVKGKSQPVSALVVGRPVRRARVRAAEGNFVGREDYLTLFATAFSRACAGEGSVLEVVAEAGVGKSRLLREATAALEAVRRVEIHCDQYESSTPYFGARSLLFAALGLDEDSDAELVLKVLHERVLPVAPDLAESLPLLGDVLDVELPAGPALRDLLPRLRRQRLRDVTRQVLRAVLGPGTLIVIEDSFWIDEASANLLVPALDGVRDQGWLVCLSRRPQSTGLHAGLGYQATVVELPPLSTQESLQLLTDTDEAMTPHVATQLAARAGGNPLFLMQLCAATGAGADVDALPEGVEAIVSSRIDRLAPADRRLLRYASVLGSRFSERDLQLTVGDLIADQPGEIAWHRLSGFVARDSEGTVRFENELFRKVAYEALPFAARRRAHAAAGEVLEQTGTEDRLELLSLHFHHAQRYDKAWSYSREAGDRAASLYANLEAVELYTRAVDAWRHVPGATGEELAHVCEGLGDALEVTSQYDAASKAYVRARRVGGSDPERELRLMLKEGVVRERLGRYPAAIRWYTRALRRLAAHAPGPAGEIEAKLLASMAATRFRQGRLEECVRWAERAAVAAEAAGHAATQAHAYFLLDSALTDLGREESQLYRSRALPIYEQMGDLIGQANVLNNLGINAYYEGHWDTALELYEQSRDRRVRAGDVMGAATVANNIAEILSDQGRTAEAEALFREAGRVFRSLGYSIGNALALSNLGRAAGRAGRYDEAHAHLVDALALFESLGAAVFVVETRARIAEVLLAQGEVERALDIADAALPSAGGAEAAVANAVLDRIRGLCLALLGQLSEGRKALIASVQTAESCGAVFELAVSLRVLGFVETAMGLPRAAEREAAGTEILNRLEVADLGNYRMCEQPPQPQPTGCSAG